MEDAKPILTMDVDSIYVPEVVARNFKCVLCQKYLFVPPVTTNDGTSFRCGRCSFIMSHLKVPVPGFEKLASYMAFPCTFDGCTATIPWGHITEHESVCRYRVISCPCYHCEDCYPISKLVQHFHEQHSKYICTDHCCIQNRNIKQPNRCLMRLIIYKKQPYLMFNYRDEIHFWISVYSIGMSHKNINFEVKFFTSNTKRAILMESGKLLPFNEQEHCINCLDKECKSKFHKYSQIYKGSENIYNKMMIAVKIEDMVKTLNSELVNYKVSVKEDTQVEDPAEEAYNKEEIEELVFLQNLECQVCRSLMSAPIYNCLTGHTICKICREKLMKCPQCKEKFTYSRCFALEDIADNIKLSCKNKKSGCKFVGNVDQNVAHQNVCNVIF